MLYRIIALIRKEFLALFKDKKTRVVLVVPPLIQLLVFGYAATFDLNHVPFAVYNEDSSSASRELIAHFESSPNSQKTTDISDSREIQPLIDAREVMLVIHISPQFKRKLVLGEPAPVQVIVDGRNSNTASIVLNYTRSIVTDFNLQWAQQHGRASPPVYLQSRAWFNDNLQSRWFLVPGIVGLLTLLVTMLVTAMSVAREREQGTFDQLLVTPLRPIEILIGKAIPGFIIGLFEATLIILIAVFWFEIPLRGELLMLYSGVFLFLLSAIGVGLMISSLAATQQQALLGAFLFLVPAIILSGFATPIENMPDAVQTLTYINPLRYFMVVLRGVFLEGMPFELLMPQLWPMALIGVTCLFLAGWLFRHRMV